MPTDDEIFNGMPVIAMIIEIPSQVYVGLKDGYDKGIEAGLHENTMERWTGLLVCRGIQAVYEDQQKQQEEMRRQINFVPNDMFVQWLQNRIDSAGSNIASMAYKDALDKYISYGRL